MHFELRRILHFAPRGHQCGALLVLFAASLAALAAHVGIDILGDVLLPHDTYDDIAHQSRAVMAYTALTIVCGVTIRLLFAALDAARTAPRSRNVRAIVDARSIRAYPALVVVAAFILLTGMEFVDLAAAGHPCADIGDLLGGSIWLGVAITLPVALGAAYAASRVVRWATAVHLIAIRMIGTWFVRRARPANAARFGSRRPLPYFTRTPALTRSATRRGPPARLTTAKARFCSAI
jgi:hypothetical protein